MSQNWSDDTYEPSNVVITDAQKIENNFNVLKTTFYGSSTPSNAENGQTWCYTGDGTYYYYRQYLNGWRNIFRVHKSTYKVEAINCTGTLNGYDTGTSSGNIPISNGVINNSLNSDFLDNQHGSYYQNSSNQNAGTLPAARIGNNSLPVTKMEGGAFSVWSNFTALGAIGPVWDTSHYFTKTHGWITDNHNRLRCFVGIHVSGGGNANLRVYINGQYGNYITFGTSGSDQEGNFYLDMNGSTRGTREVIIQLNSSAPVITQNYVFFKWE